MKYEVLDKQENKRMARKGKGVPQGSESSEDEPVQEEVKDPKAKKKYPKAKGGKKYFLRAKSQDQESSEEQEEEVDDDHRHYITKKVIEKRLISDQLNKKAGRIDLS